MSDKAVEAGSSWLSEFSSNWLQRFTNPVTGAFSVSWLIINYRIPVLIFSDGSYADKFKYIEQSIFATPQDIWLRGVLYPSLASVLYIFVLPFPTKWVYYWTLTRQKGLNKVRNDVQGVKQLTLAESVDLEKKLATAEAVAEQARQGQSQLENAHKEELDRQLQVLRIPIEQERSSLQQKRLDYDRAIGTANEKIKALSWELTCAAVGNIRLSSEADKARAAKNFLVAREFKIEGFGFKDVIKFGHDGAIEYSPENRFISWEMSDDIRVKIFDESSVQIGMLWLEVRSLEWRGQLGNVAGVKLIREVDA